jgi:hypothetical protein
MRWILSVIAMTYNKINGLSGHVWGGRFFSRIVEAPVLWLKAIMPEHEQLLLSFVPSTQ